MNRIAAASGAFNTFGSISSMLIVKLIYNYHLHIIYLSAAEISRTKIPCDRLPSQSASQKHNQEKSPQTFARLVNFSKMCLLYLRIIQSCYFDYRMKFLFLMFSPRVLRFVLCSLEVDVLRAQRIMGFLT